MSLLHHNSKCHPTLFVVFETQHRRSEIRKEYRLYQESVGSEWIENDELSRLLSLSKHQLKGYRGRGLLGYTMIGNKIYYKRHEVERFIKRHINK